MGKSSSPSTPDYTGAALATSNSSKYNETTPYGTVGWTLRPGADPTNPQPGDYTRTTTLSDGQQSLYDQGLQNQLASALAAQSTLSGLGDTQATQDALYRRYTQYYDQNFDRDEANLRTRLANQGLSEGSTVWDNAMAKFNQTKDTAYADATDRAVQNADQSQNNAVSRLAQLMSLSGINLPTSANTGTTTDYSTAAQNTYNSNLASANADNASAAQTTQGAIGAASLAAMMFF